MNTHSSRITRKIAEVLKLVGRGLIDNQGLGLDTLMTFVYGLTSEVVASASSAELASIVTLSNSFLA